MSIKHELYWSTDGRSFHSAQDIAYLVAKAKPEIEDCDAQTVRLTANITAAEWFLDRRRELSKSFIKYPEGFASSHARANFKCMLQKVFTGAKWERDVLRPLRFDLIILCCLVLTPVLFKKVEQLGLQYVFAKQVNNDFKDLDPLIPDWIAKTSKTIAKDTSFSKNAAAKALIEGFLTCDVPFLAMTNSASSPIATANFAALP